MADARPYLPLEPGDDLTAERWERMRALAEAALAEHGHDRLPGAAVAADASLAFARVEAGAVRVQGQDLEAALGAEPSWGHQLAARVRLPALEVKGAVIASGGVLAAPASQRAQLVSALLAGPAAADGALPTWSATNATIGAVNLSLARPARALVLCHLGVGAAAACSIRLLRQTGDAAPQPAALSWESLTEAQRTGLAASTGEAREALLASLGAGAAGAVWRWSPSAAGQRHDGAVRVHEIVHLRAGAHRLELVLVGAATLSGRLMQVIAWSAP